MGNPPTGWFLSNSTLSSVGLECGVLDTVTCGRTAILSENGALDEGCEMMRLYSNGEGRTVLCD